ncbi:MAG: radical SAM protein [Candidatus Omnitrophica bacterium]|nr:radical SAM protein [Candidatus Omnitrophota bacterium]
MADVRQFSSDKILKHLDRVNEWLSGDNPPPITVELDMTNVCNHRCPECVSNYFQNTDKSSISRELAFRIIRQLAEAKVRGLIFTGGGEPLCNPDTVDAVKMAKELGLDIGFITNGSLLNRENILVLTKCCTWIRVSLDASCPEMFQKTHGMNGKEYERITGNTQQLTSVKKDIGSDCTIGIGYLTCDDTVDGMIEASKMCRSLGVNYLQFRPMQIHRGGRFDYHWTEVNGRIEECLQHSYGGYKVLYSKHKYDMIKDPKYGRNYGRCYGHQFATVISASGKMYICCHLRGYDKYCIGDLNKNTFKEIWDSERRKEVARNIDFRDCMPLCRDNTFNQILWNIKKPGEHLNFL